MMKKTLLLLGGMLLGGVIGYIVCVRLDIYWLKMLITAVVIITSAVIVIRSLFKPPKK